MTPYQTMVSHLTRVISSVIQIGYSRSCKDDKIILLQLSTVTRYQRTVAVDVSDTA